MAISDIFTTPFLIYLGISFLLLGLLGMYFTQKITEQNHKISSMFDLVSTIAEEMNANRNTAAQVQNFTPNFTPNFTQNTQQAFQQNLIPVSDDEDIPEEKNKADEEDDDEEEDDDDEDEDEDDDDEDDEDDDDDDQENKDDKNNETFEIKNVNFDKSIFNIDNFIENLDEIKLSKEDKYDDKDDDEDDDDDDEDDEDDDEDDDENFHFLPSEIEDVPEYSTLDFEKVSTGENASDDHLKKINIFNSDSEEVSKNLQLVDYKKFSISKLREVVVEKGFVTDASKMKKNELLHLLVKE